MSGSAGCTGDCSGDGEVTVDELIAMVNVALEASPLSGCPIGDADGDGAVSINEIVLGVNNALVGCVASTTPTATPSATPTAGAGSYVGKYWGTAAGGTFLVEFSVVSSGAAAGSLSLITPDFAAVSGQGSAGGVSFKAAASGQANLSSGAYALSGTQAGSRFDIAGQLPTGPAAVGTLNVTIYDQPFQGSLQSGTPPPQPTATPTPGCNTGSLQMSFSNASANFNGDATGFTVAKMNTAIEQPAPDYIAGFNETYNSTFAGIDCSQPRNLQISIYGVRGGLAGGQSFPAGQGPFNGAGAIVYYGQEGAGGDAVWSSSSGTVFVDSVSGSVVTLRVVGAAMSVTAGAATGSVTLDVSGQVNNFTHQAP